MNILYLGPYRQIDYIGQASLLHIESIKKTISHNDKLLTRPVYLDTSLTLDTNEYITNEHIKLDHVDTIIQYLPVNFIAIKKNVKNIAIPILDPKLYNISQDYEYQKLNLCDKILIEDEKQKNLLKACVTKKPIETYEEKITDSYLQKFNLDPTENHYKIGFLGQYNTNKQIINKIIYAFLLASRYNSNIKLYFFLRGKEHEKSELENSISEIKKQLKVPFYINKIYTMFGILDIKESITALNSIDCFLSLNDDYRYTLYEKLFMSSNSSIRKHIINRYNINSLEMPVMIVNNIHEYKNTVSSVNTQDLINKMIHISSNPQKYKPTNYKSLGTIICN